MKLFIAFLSILFISAIGDEIYSPAPLIKKDEIRFQNIQQSNSAQLVAYSNLPSRQRNYLKDACLKRTEFFKERISNGYFILNNDIEKYAGKIFQEILNANPALDKKMQLFVSRSEEPNAFNTGDGNIVLNVGLLSKVQNDAELAFVISHEMAHQRMEHVNKSMLSKAEKYTDKDFQKTLRKTAKEEYHTNAKLEALILPMIYGDRKFSRRDELQADSAGAIYMMNAGYSFNGVLTALKLLKTIDRYHDADPLELKEYFSFQQIHSKEYWFRGNHTSSLGAFEQEKDSIEDSLKTHPNIDQRIEAMERLMAGKKNSEKLYSSSEAEFKVFRLQATEELMFDNLMWGDLARAMYEAFILSRDNLNNDYSNAILSLCFSRLYHLQKLHKVHLEVPMPNPKYFEESYNDLIDFVNEIRMEETILMSSHFLPKKEYANSEVYEAAKIYNAYVKMDGSYSAMRDSFIKKYPEGWFNEIFTNLIK